MCLVKFGGRLAARRLWLRFLWPGTSPRGPRIEPRLPIMKRTVYAVTFYPRYLIIYFFFDALPSRVDRRFAACVKRSLSPVGPSFFLADTASVVNLLFSWGVKVTHSVLHHNPKPNSTLRRCSPAKGRSSTAEAVRQTRCLQSGH